MAWKRFIIEFGTGVDVHGIDVTKAAQKAVKDAISHCCLVGLGETLELEDVLENVKVEIKIGSPFHEKIDRSKVLAQLPPYKNCELEIVEGGLAFRGTNAPQFGVGETIVLVNAAVTVYVNK